MNKLSEYVMMDMNLLGVEESMWCRINRCGKQSLPIQPNPRWKIRTLSENNDDYVYLIS